jgi:hypothetical protein
MNDIWTNKLSEYLDGELDSGERVALEGHLATCGQCYATLAELREVVARAKSLEDREPAKELWLGIRAGIAGSRAVVDRPVRHDRRRFSLTVGQLLAASIALVLLSSGGAWLTLRQREKVTPTFATPRERFTAVSWTNETDIAIADLQTALTQNERRLDTATVRVVRENLAIIDRAITDARVALQRDPGNTYLNLHLANTMRRKVELLRRVNDLVAAQS